MTLVSSPRLALLAFLALAGGYLLAESVLAGALGPPLDDGWIYMAFARSLAAGEGITYPGHDGPVAAVTGPLWCLLLAAMFTVFGAGVVAGKLLGLGAGLFALWGVYRLGVAATGDVRTAAITSLVTAVSARFLWGALSMMEVPLFVGAVAWGLALHLDAEKGRRRSWWPAAVVLWLSGWARPECFVFVVLAAVRRRRLAGLALVAGLLAVYPLYHLAVYGHPLPTTFYAKAASTSPLAIARHDGVVAALGALGANLGMQLAQVAAFLPTFLPFLVPGLALGIRRGMRERNGVPFVAACLLLFVLARGALGLQSPWFQNGRYFTHTWPMFALICLHGFDLSRCAVRTSTIAVLALYGALFVFLPHDMLALCFDWTDPGFRLEQQYAALFGLLGGAAAVVAVGAVAGRGIGRLARPPVWLLPVWLAPALLLGAVRHGQGVRDTYELNVAIAKHVREEVPEGELVACHDIGALGWFAERPLLDLAGLGSPEVVFRPRAPGQPIDFAAILAEHRPRWLCLTPAQADRLNPERRLPSGLASSRVVVEIVLPENVTVLGGVFQLSELTWSR